VAEAEHSLVLIDQLAEDREGVSVVRRIDGRLAIPGKVEFRRPLSRQGHGSGKLAGEHRGIDQAFERRGCKGNPVSSLVSDGHGAALLPVGRKKNGWFDEQLPLIDTSRVENGGIPGKQDLMIRDGVFQQAIEVDGDLAGMILRML
jgi:hypothetical protein